MIMAQLDVHELGPDCLAALIYCLAWWKLTWEQGCLTHAGVRAQGGRMTQCMERLHVGDSMEVKGPLGHFIYQGKGAFRHSGHPGKATTMSMIAGGTGITPMYQVIQVWPQRLSWLSCQWL